MRRLEAITNAEIDELLAAGVGLLALDGRFLEERGSGNRLPEGTIEMPYPTYPEAVTRFFRAAGAEAWSDYNYMPTMAGEMVRDRSLIRGASLDQIRTMLTWCVRGERFCDGHWAAVLSDGTISLLLERLRVIREEGVLRP